MNPISKLLDEQKLNDFSFYDSTVNKTYTLNLCDKIAISRLIELNPELKNDKQFIIINMNPEDVRKLTKMKIIKRIKNSAYVFDTNFYILLK